MRLWLAMGCGGVFLLGCSGLLGPQTELARAISEAGLTPSRAPAVTLTFRCAPAQGGCVQAMRARAEGLAAAAEIQIRAQESGSDTLALSLPALDERLQSAFVGLLQGAGGFCIRAPAEAEARTLFWQDAVAVDPSLSPEDASIGLVSSPGTIAEDTLSRLHQLARDAGYVVGLEQAEGRERVLLLDATCGLSGADLASVEFTQDPVRGAPLLEVSLTAAGAERLTTFSAAHVDEPVAMMQGERVLMMPVVREPITGGRLQIEQGYAGGWLERVLSIQVLGEQLRHPYPEGSAVTYASAAAGG